MIKKALALLVAACLFIIYNDNLSYGVGSTNRTDASEPCGVGVHRMVFAARLQAQSFLAEQLVGRNFTYAQNLFSTSCERVSLKNTYGDYCGRLKDGRLLILVKIRVRPSAHVFATRGRQKCYENVFKVKLSELVFKRTKLYKRVVEAVAKKEGKKSLKGKIFVSFPDGLRPPFSYNDFIKVKIKVVY